MRTVIFFTYFGLYMIYSCIKIVKLKFLEKYSTMEKAEEYKHKCARYWGQAMMKFIGVKVRVEGSENLPDGNCLFVGNHQGYADIPIMLGYIHKPMGFVAKKQMSKIPLLSYWMEKIHCIFMDRDNIREAVKSINEGVEVLTKGHSLVIYPEGTRSKGAHLGEFKKGSLKLGIKAKVPIIPITVIGSYKVYEGNGNRVKPVEVILRINKPIIPNELSKEEQNNLAEIIRDIVKKDMEV